MDNIDTRPPYINPDEEIGEIIREWDKASEQEKLKVAKDVIRSAIYILYERELYKRFSHERTVIQNSRHWNRDEMQEILEDALDSAPYSSYYMKNNNEFWSWLKEMEEKYTYIALELLEDNWRNTSKKDRIETRQYTKSWAIESLHELQFQDSPEMREIVDKVEENIRERLLKEAIRLDYHMGNGGWLSDHKAKGLDSEDTARNSDDDYPESSMFTASTEINSPDASREPDDDLDEAFDRLVEKVINEAFED